MSCEAPAGWREVRLGDLLKVEHGYAFKSAHFTDPADDEPIVVAIGNFKYTGGFRFEDTAVKGYDADYPERFKLTAGDILLVMTCQTQGGEILGIPARVPDDGRTYLHNQRIGKVRFTSDQLDPDFAYWLFLSPDFNRELCRTASGSKILHTAPARIENHRFALPPLDEQRRIASVLWALNDKAESNKRLSRPLAETAKIAFQARFDAGEFGALPPNWRYGTLGDLAAVTKRSVRPDQTPERLFEHFSIPAYDDGDGPELVHGEAMLSGKTLVSDANVVLLSKLNPRIKRVWWARPTGAGVPVCSPEFLALLPREGIPSSYLYASVAHGERFYEDLLANASGTTGSRQRVKPADALNCKVVIPDAQTLREWDQFAGPLYGAAHALTAESRILAELRATLLPRLFRGALRVSPAPALPLKIAA